jgi:hypothetical protein
MTGEQPGHAPGEPGAGRPAGTAGQPAADAEGGDAACWANLVCEECGAVRTEGHRDGCRSAAPPPGGGLPEGSLPESSGPPPAPSPR